MEKEILEQVKDSIELCKHDIITSIDKHTNMLLEAVNMYIDELKKLREYSCSDCEDTGEVMSNNPEEGVIKCHCRSDEDKHESN